MFIDFGAELKGKETSIVTHQPFRLNSLGTAFLQLLALKSQGGLSSTDRNGFAARSYGSEDMV